MTQRISSISIRTSGQQAYEPLGKGGGIIAGQSGEGTLSSHLAVGELPNSWFGNGFQSARDSGIQP